MTSAERAQPDFGHHGSHAFGVHLDFWGAGPLLIRWGRRKWWFEHSDMFGPLILQQSDMMPAERQPIRETDLFWTAFNAWMKSGKRCRAVRNKRGQVRFWLCYAPQTVYAK